jgi:HAD superfamily hydrolase (TIGR01549 family)
LEPGPERALELFHRVRAYPRRWVPYDDALPTLDALRGRGLTIGVLTNVPSQERVDRLISDALRERLDFLLTSAEAGAPKPDPRIFRIALDRAGVRPEEALHVGDQYDSDVVGARAVGVPALLLDREDAYRHLTDVPRIRSLTEVLRYLDDPESSPPGQGPTSSAR